MDRYPTIRYTKHERFPRYYAHVNRIYLGEVFKIGQGRWVAKRPGVESVAIGTYETRERAARYLWDRIGGYC